MKNVYFKKNVQKKKVFSTIGKERTSERKISPFIKFKYLYVALKMIILKYIFV